MRKILLKPIGVATYRILYPAPGANHQNAGGRAVKAMGLHRVGVARPNQGAVWLGNTIQQNFEGVGT